MTTFNHQKATQAVNYFIHLNGGSIDKMKALKLLWLSDKIHLMQYGRMITGDVYFAMKNGHVASATKDIIDEKRNHVSDEVLDYRNNYILKTQSITLGSKQEPDLMVFSDSDQEVMDLVFEKFGKFDQEYLSEVVSHSFSEWKRYEELFKLNPKHRAKLSLEDHFNGLDILQGYSVELDEENVKLIKEYSLETA